MKALFSKFMGESRYWWVVLLAGILMVICGFAYWFWPVVGYAVASQLFGWLLIVIGVVQLLQASGPHAGRGWGWWLAGGIIDMFIGFMMVRSVVTGHGYDKLPHITRIHILGILSRNAVIRHKTRSKINLFRLT